MKLFYFLCFVSTIAFGQINTENLVDISWYKTSRNGDKVVFSSIKRHNSGNYFVRLRSDQSFSMPIPKLTRCGNEKRRVRKGTWRIETINTDTVLILESEDIYLRYKILYANAGVLKLQTYRSIN